MKASTAYDGVEEIYPLIGPVPAHWRVLDLKLISNVFPSNVDKKNRRRRDPRSLMQLHGRVLQRRYKAEHAIHEGFSYLRTNQEVYAEKMGCSLYKRLRNG